MKILGDLHTHSKFSKFNHGKNTVIENINAAKKKGLSFYGISDHGPKHIFYGISNKNLNKARQIVNEYNLSNQGMKVYLGVEANLIGKDGKIDVTDEQIKLLDYLVVGYHKGTITNFVGYFFAKKSKKQIEKNTNAYINCVKKYNVAFLSHLNTYIKVDVLKLAFACAETNTLIELNTRHFNFTDNEIKDMIEKTNVKFIISSDAHRASRIGCVDYAIDMVKKYNIPSERIVNLNKEFIPKEAN